MNIINQVNDHNLIGTIKDDGIVEDRALGIYPNSVYALYTCI